MNFGAMQTRVQQTTSLQAIDTVYVKQFLNEALLDFARDASTSPVRFTFNTVVGQTDYDLTGAVVSATGIIRVLPDEDDPSIVHSYDFDVRGLGTLVLSPAPTAVGAVTGWAVPRPAKLVNDADVPTIPEEYHRAIVYRACQLVCEWDRQDTVDVQMWEGKYEGEVAKALKEKKRGRAPRTLKPSAQLNASTVGVMRVP